ncbi:MAG: hypothetical protein E7377_04060 [Clostridiales bacterium]|nr:hypothetical protein [Clostridiales bacterium]
MKRSEKITVAIVTMVVGVLLIAMRDSFIGIIMSVAGVALIALGILDVFNRLIPPAVVKGVAGALIIICGWVLVEAVLYIVAALLLISGILLLYDKIKKGVRCDNLLFTVLEYVTPAVFILIGFLFLFHQAMSLTIVFIVGGVFTVAEGGVLLLNAFSQE